MVLSFTVIVIGFELINLHWVEACHTYHIATLLTRKREMLVYPQSGIEFHRNEKDVGENCTPWPIPYKILV